MNFIINNIADAPKYSTKVPLTTYGEPMPIPSGETPTKDKYLQALHKNTQQHVKQICEAYQDALAKVNIVKQRPPYKLTFEEANEARKAVRKVVTLLDNYVETGYPYTPFQEWQDEQLPFYSFTRYFPWFDEETLTQEVYQIAIYPHTMVHICTDLTWTGLFTHSTRLTNPSYIPWYRPLHRKVVKNSRGSQRLQPPAKQPTPYLPQNTGKLTLDMHKLALPGITTYLCYQPSPSSSALPFPHNKGEWLAYTTELKYHNGYSD